MAKRYSPLISLLFCLLTLGACEAIPPRDPATLRLSMSAEPTILNPILASDAPASRVLNYVNDTLIERNPDTFGFDPKLAKGWHISPDHLAYTFYLRQDVTWHDGAPFTADDVAYSFARIQDPSVEAPFLRVYYADVDKVEKIDDYTVRFVYKRPYFLGLSVCGSMPIVPRHVFEDGTDFNTHSANRHPVGTGPFKFEAWKTNKKITLTRNEKYWGIKPALKRVEYKIITDDSVALQVLKKGELDYAGLRPIQWERQTTSAKFNDDFTKFRSLEPGFNYIGWNNKSPFFSDRRVRLAMTHLVDRQKLLEKINYGLGKVIESPFFIASAQYNTDLKSIPYDPEKARALLKEAGWADTDGDAILDKDGKNFSFTFLYPSASKFSERVAPILKEDFKKVGIEMKIERMEWAAFLTKIMKHELDATALGWSGGYDDEDPYQIWHSSQAKEKKGSNFISFENPEADRLIEAARTEFDRKKRNELYKKFQQILYDEQPYTFMFASDSLEVVSKRFKNVIQHKAGLNPLEWELGEIK